MRSTPIQQTAHNMYPAVLKTNLTADHVPQIKRNIRELMSGNEAMQGKTNTDIANIRGSILNNENTKWSARGTKLGVFVTLVTNTIVYWGDNGMTTNILQITAISGMALEFIISYYRKRRAHQIQNASAKKQLLETTGATISFMKESATMSKRCLEVNPQVDIALTMNGFQGYMAALPPSVVPNLLASAWAKVGTTLSAPNTPERQELLIADILGTVLPLMHFYDQALTRQMIELGYQPAPDDIDSSQDDAAIPHEEKSNGDLEIVLEG